MLLSPAWMNIIKLLSQAEAASSQMYVLTASVLSPASYVCGLWDLSGEKPFLNRRKEENGNHARKRISVFFCAMYPPSGAACQWHALLQENSIVLEFDNL